MPIKVIIPSYNRAKTCRSQKYFSDHNLWQVNILVHDEKQRREYERELFPAEYWKKDLTPIRLIQTDTEHTVTAQRQWALDNLIENGEWFIFADDNIDGVGAMLGAGDNKDHPITQQDFQGRVRGLIKLAEPEKINLIGFATTDNVYFRQKRYGMVGFVLGKLKIVRKSGINYDPAIVMKEDYDFTAAHLLRDGKVIIDRWVRPTAKHFEAGGCGKREDRVEIYKQSTKQLMEKYPTLFRSKKNGEELQIRYTSKEQIAKWQFFMENRKKI